MPETEFSAPNNIVYIIYRKKSKASVGGDLPPTNGNMLTLTVNRNDAGQRADKFFMKSLNGIPASLLYKYLRTKKIKRNRKRLSPQDMLCEGDVIDMYIPEEFYPSATAPREAFMTLTPHIDVLYEDDSLILLNKRPGMSCVPDERETDNTLISHLKAYLYRKGEYDPAAENSFAPALCNRIDRNTCGIVIAAKTAEALRHINNEIKERRVDKRYLCVVHGIPQKKNATLHGYLVKDSKNNKVTVYDTAPRLPGAKTVITEYRVLTSDSERDISLLEVTLHTGRTHQIRAHLGHIGHPLYGDGKYGVNKIDRKAGYKYQALCSYKLTLDGVVYGISPKDIWFVADLFPNFDKRL